MMISIQIFIFLSIVFYTSAWMEKIPMKPSLNECFHQRRALLNSTDSIKDNFHGFCIQKYRLKLVKKILSALTNETANWIEELLRMSENDATQKRQTHFSRTHKEIRVLVSCVRELSDYFNCMNLLKRNTSVKPNRFDALSAIHQRFADNVHHLLPLHRILLTIMENSSRQKVPFTVLLFWDSRLDNETRRPSGSVFFSKHLAGLCNGRVKDVSYAYWNDPNGDLVRNCALQGELFNRRDLTALNTRSHLENISEPFAVAPFDFEIKHEDVYLSVGGTLAQAESVLRT